MAEKPYDGGGAACGGEIVLTPTSDPNWLLLEEGFAPLREHEIESIFAISNGYVGTRASLEEDSRFSQPGAFLAGVFVEDPDSMLGPYLALLPGWPHLEIKVEGQPLSIEAGRLLYHRRMLDLRQGVLWREWRHEDPSGRVTRACFLRFASLSDRHALVQSVHLTAENYSGRVEILASPTFPGAEHRFSPAVATAVLHAGKTCIALAAGACAEPSAEATVIQSANPAAGVRRRWAWNARLGARLRLDRPVVVCTSREETHPLASAQTRLADILARGVDALARAHVDAWSRRWSVADIRIAGDAEAQRAIRFAAYHLIAAANPGDEHVSIGARALTGEAYHGHVFWDTESYMLPFYIFTDPATARALLMYRCNTLDAARRRAAARGYRGALYAWESADTGDDVTPEAAIAPDGRVVAILTGAHEQHVSADVAYAVWLYWRTTGDTGFMLEGGVDILVETARFWASRATIEADGRAHIRAVIGPDEYHEMIDDNAYTNCMARWNLLRAADAADLLAKECGAAWDERARRLALDDAERAEWRRIAAALAVGFDPETGIIEQFDGYAALEEIDVRAHAGCATPIDLCLGPERTRRSKAVKQADVVALSAFLWDEWPQSVHRANFDYYEPRTGHGSSLSPAIYALVAARLGLAEKFLEYFRQAAEIDLSNNMGNAAGGVHMAALGGLWQSVIFGVAGVRPREDGVALDPHLPDGWAEICFAIEWRRRLLRVTLAATEPHIRVGVEGAQELRLALVDGPSCVARPGASYSIGRDGATWGAWREAQ